MFQSLLDTVLFSIGPAQPTVGMAIIWLLSIIFLLVSFRFIKRIWLPSLLENRDIVDKDVRRLHLLLRYTFFSCFLLSTLFFSGFDFDLTPKSNINFKISYFLITIVIFQVARIFDWFTSNIFIHDAFVNNAQPKKSIESVSLQSETRVSNIGRYFVFTIAANLIIQLLDLDITLFSRSLSNGLTFNFKLSNILVVLLIVFGTQLLIWIITQIVLRNIYMRNNLDLGASFAISQIFKYVVWTFAIFFGMNAIGIDITLLLGGAAALLVGIGLGLQSTFNDFIAGIVLLFERSVKVGDMLNASGTVGRVKKIGMRSSVLEIRDSTSVIVPNSQLVNREVSNWTYDNDKTRFEVKVGVGYGSDTALVKKLLLEVANKSPYVIQYPPPFVRFEDFGNSALDFSLYFFSRNYLVIEDIKSDLRFDIDAVFRKHNIQIPFPQQDVHIRSYIKD